MNLTEAQNAFAVRLYRWSFTDLLHEMRSGCPLMSSVGLHNRRVAAFVLWVETMSDEGKETTARALIRLAHENAAALCGEALSAEEQKAWNHEFYEQTTFYAHQLPALMTADRNHSHFKAVDPDLCLDTLAALLPPLMGKPSRRRSSIRTTRRIGDWKLITEFTFYRRDRDLRFEYQFVRADGSPIIGHDSPFPRTLFRFYGVYTTSVVVPSRLDSEPMAKVMAKLGEYFVARADPLFDGLGVKD